MDRYWVGGTGTWDASNTANWSATSGGAGGDSAPTLNDDVFFDANSDAGGIFTVTIGAGAVCRDITIAGLEQVMTLAGSAAWSVYGSLAFPATNLTFTYSGTISYLATSTGKTITTNGITLTCNAVFSSANGEWSLGSAYVGANNVTIAVAAGSFISNNYSISANFFGISSGSFLKSINFGSSTLNLIGGIPFTVSSTIGLTFNAGTSNIIFGGASPVFSGGGLIYNNITFFNVAPGMVTINGANTLNNLTFTSPNSTGIRNIILAANQTVNGTLTLGTANTAIRRMFMFSDVVGTPRTITANAIAALADVDFRDIVAAGASGTWSGTRLGNCLGNGNITFDAGKNVYRIGANNWSATQWALSSGGTVNVNNFPLAQDTAIVDNNSSAGTMGFDQGWNIGNIDCSARTAAYTFLFGVVSYYGNIILSSAITPSGTGTGAFCGQGKSQNITSSGKTFLFSFNLNNATGTLQLQDALTTSGVFTLTSGTLDLNDKNLTALTFSSNNSNVRSIAFGAGSINLTGSGAGVSFDMTTATNFTYSGTAIVNILYSGAATSNVVFGPTGISESNVLNFNLTSGTYSVNLTGSYKSVDFTGFAGTLQNITRNFYGNVTYSTGMALSAGGNETRFRATAITQVITTNGKTLDFALTKDAAGTLQLADNLTQGVTRTFTHTAGTIDLNDNDLNAGLWSSTGAVARHLDTGATGELHIAGATLTASGSNLTTSGTGLISMDSASAKTFAGGGFTYPTLNQGGLGQLAITGANRFKDVTNTVQPCTIVFPANVTTSVEDFSLNGTAGNLVTIQSSTAGQRFNLVKVV